MKKRRMVCAAVLAALCLTGCYGGAKELSDEYITIGEYLGIEVEEIKISETTEEDIDKVVDYMMDSYTRDKGLPDDTKITDEMVRDGISTTAQTVEELRDEIRGQIEDVRQESAEETLETRVWETVIDNTEVKKWPEDRVAEVKENLIDQYEGYASEGGMEYEEYMEAIELTEDDLEEAAKASVKQELIAELIAQENGLNPTEEEFQAALEDYAEEYMFTNVDLLLEAVPEEEMHLLVVQDKVKEWLADHCTVVEAQEEEDSK